MGVLDVVSPELSNFKEAYPIIHKFWNHSLSTIPYKRNQGHFRKTFLLQSIAIQDLLKLPKLLQAVHWFHLHLWSRHYSWQYFTVPFGNIRTTIVLVGLSIVGYSSLWPRASSFYPYGISHPIVSSLTLMLHLHQFWSPFSSPIPARSWFMIGLHPCQ